MAALLAEPLTGWATVRLEKTINTNAARKQDPRACLQTKFNFMLCGHVTLSGCPESSFRTSPFSLPSTGIGYFGECRGRNQALHPPDCAYIISQRTISDETRGKGVTFRAPTTCRATPCSCPQWSLWRFFRVPRGLLAPCASASPPEFR